MTRIAIIFFSLVSTVLMGTFIVIVLTMGYDTMMPIIYAVVVGLVLSVPISWVLAAKIYAMQSK